MILAAVALNVLDLELSWMFVSRHGLSAEANPLMAEALAFGLLGGIAMKAALLSIIFAAASLRPASARVLIGGAALAGAIGVISAAVA